MANLHRSRITLIILFTCLSLFPPTSQIRANRKQPNDAVPLVGILYQPGFEAFEGVITPQKNYQYIFRSYEKWVSQTGAMPVLIPYDIDSKTFRFIVESLQMVLLPGGNALFYKENGKITTFHNVVKTVYQIA